MNKKNELLKDLNISLEKLKTFSCPEFDDVYSKVYFKEILKDQFKNTNEPYSLIFGDFNKLGLINDLYGHDFGDNALNLSIKLIKKKLPSNSMIVRAGGDELYIIIPNSNKQIADSYCNAINDAIAKKSVLLGGLSIELASSDSTYGDIDKLIELTDTAVNKVKAARTEDNSLADVLADDFLPLLKPNNISTLESTNWDELNNHINISIYEFLQNFRPSKTLQFDKNQIIDTTSFITNSFIHLLNEKLDTKIPENVSNAIKEEYPYPVDISNTANDSQNLTNIDDDTCNLIHSLVSQDKNINIDNLSEEEISNLSITCDDILEYLIRDNTKLFNKSYFRNFLSKELCKSNEPLSASYITASGIKLSNFVYDHSFTDSRLDKTNTIFINSLKEKLDFDDTSFDTSDNGIYVVSQGAGNYLVLYPKKIEKDVQSKVASAVNETNSYSDIKDPNSSFKLSYYSLKDNQQVSKNNSDDLIKYVRKLKDEANYTKDSLKKDLFKSSDAFFAFKKSINGCIDFYLNNIPNASNDINKTTTFIRNIYTSFLNQEALHNNSRFSKKTSGLNNENNIEYDR